MNIKTLSLKDKIYKINDILIEKEFTQIHDEFVYNSWEFDKKEIFESEDYAVRGRLHTKNLEKDTIDIIGHNNPLINFAINVKYQLQSLLLQKPLKLHRINTNIQYFGMESSFHKDSDKENSWSFVYFLSAEWKTQWGGEFVVMTKPGDYSYVPYIPNTGVLFPANLEHMGYSPNRLCTVPRLSIAFTYHGIY